MKNTIAILSLLAFVATGFAAEGAKKSAAELEKEKAMANPYPNDFGPEKIDDEIKDYPADKKEGYKLLLQRCTVCHTAARPLNSRFVEPNEGLDGDKAAKAKKQEAAVAALKKSNPELFKDNSIWQIEAGIWGRYVKRMMSKPGCGKAAGGQMTDAEAKKIYEFLVFDGKRKLGANAEKWKAHRTKLIEKLKAEKPARYKELAASKEL
jgi:mono/diheme cytochrome c family protein